MYSFTACLAASIDLKTSLTVRGFLCHGLKIGFQVGAEGGSFGRILEELAAYEGQRKSRKGVILVRLWGVIAEYLMGVMGVMGVRGSNREF